MAVIFTEGFDVYNGVGSTTGLLTRWVGSPYAFNTGSTSGMSMATGRFGGQCFKYTNTTGTYGTTVTTGFASSASSTITLGMAFRFDGAFTIDIPFLCFSTGGNPQCGLVLQPGGQLTVARISNYQNPSYAALATTSSPFVVGVWNYIVLTINLATTTTGSFNLYLNGSVVPTLSGTNVNLLNYTPSNLIDAIHIGNARNDNRCPSWSIDDLYLLNTATNLGEKKIETIRPASDSSVVWVPNSGANNYSRVNETTSDGDTSYVSGTNVGDRDLYALGALSSSPTTIDAVNVIVIGEKTDTGTRTIYNSVQSGGVDSDGSSFNLNTSYNRFDRLLTTDPNGGGAWSVSTVNALKVGPKVAS